MELKPIGCSVWPMELQRRGIGIPGSNVASIFGNQGIAAMGMGIGHSEDARAERRILDDRVRRTEGRSMRDRFGIGSRIGRIGGGSGGGEERWADTQERDDHTYGARELLVLPDVARLLPDLPRVQCSSAFLT